MAYNNYNYPPNPNAMNPMPGGQFGQPMPLPMPSYNTGTPNMMNPGMNMPAPNPAFPSMPNPYPNPTMTPGFSNPAPAPSFNTGYQPNAGMYGNTNMPTNNMPMMTPNMPL